MNPDTSQMDLTGLSVAVGRIEEKLSHLAGMEDRLRNVETQLTELKAQQRPRAPWWAITGGAAAIIAAIAGFWQLFSLAADIASRLP